MTELITEIRPLPADPNMRRVRIGNKTVATLRASDIETLGLEIGTAWTAKLQDEAERTMASLKARRDAMKLLGRRQYSRLEIVERLTKNAHEHNIAEQVADELSDEGWVDDASMAASLADELIRRKSAGRQMLNAKLKARKIDANLAEKTTRAAASSNDEFVSALSLAKRKLSTQTNRSAAAAARRIAGTLGRKGFDHEVIERVLHELNLHRDAFDE
jgi:SOS response regulatory protein OraA/RecX